MAKKNINKNVTKHVLKIIGNLPDNSKMIVQLKYILCVCRS